MSSHIHEEICRLQYISNALHKRNLSLLSIADGGYQDRYYTTSLI
jgi:hypothetical protein